MKKTYAHPRGMMALKIMILPVLISFLLGQTGCINSKPKIPPNTDIKTVLVVPLKNQTLIHGEGETYRCDLCGAMFTTSRVEKNAAVYVTDHLIGVLSGREAITLMPNNRVDAVRRELLLEYESPPSELILLSETGKRLGADAVLTGSVYKFIQRVGGDFSADSPASVGLTLDLIDVKTGLLIWHARFDETQEYLTNNFMKIFTFFKRGGKWITAEKLSAAGIEKLLEGSPIP